MNAKLHLEHYNREFGNFTVTNILGFQQNIKYVQLFIWKLSKQKIPLPTYLT